MNEPIPPSWEDLATNRERLARIETKVDMILATHVVQDSKLAALDARQLALEQGRMANRADIVRALAEIELMKQERAQVDLSAPQFIEKMKNWDETSETVKKNSLILLTRRNMRREEWAVLAALAAGAGTLAGGIPIIVQALGG